MKQKYSILFMTLSIFWMATCKRKVQLPDIGENIHSPTDVSASKDGSHFYVINANMDNSFSSGSILVLDNDGNKVKALETPRLGQVLHVAGDKLFAAFDFSGDNDETSASVQMYDVSSPENPVLTQSWDIDCTPINVTARENYDYFAVACQRGQILIGDLTTNELKTVRSYGSARRALHIDKKRNLLFAFVADLGTVEVESADSLYPDIKTLNDDLKTSVEVANEVPDDFEKDDRAYRQTVSRREKYQFLVYDIAEGKKQNFPFLDSSKELAAKELRWLYYRFDEDDPTPPEKATPEELEKFKKNLEQTKKDFKLFRSNFWYAQPDAKSEDVFYVSHRGISSASYANDVVKVTITGNPLAFKDGKAQPVTTYLKFERAYSSKVEQNGGGENNYITKFGFTKAGDKEICVVNNFRDLSNFEQSGGGYFSIAAAVIGGKDPKKDWNNQLIASTRGSSYYQFAIGANNKIMTAAFYGNSVFLLDVQSDTGIRELKRIE